MPERPEPKALLQTVDDDARRLARGLLRGARFAALGVLDPHGGGPAVSRVSLATDIDGAPVFLISRLSAHFTSLEADPRASLLVGEPGKGDPLAHPRMTVIGRAEIAEGERRERLRRRFLARHPKAALYADFGDFAFWRLSLERASLNGGFGKAFELSPADLLSAAPEGLAALEPSALEHMNADHADAVTLYAERLLGREAGSWRLIGIDAEGLDLASGDAVARLWFDRPLQRAEELHPTLAALVRRAREAG